MLTNASGLSAVDIYVWRRKKKHKETSIEAIRRRNDEIQIFEIECDYEIEISKFSDALTKSLEDNLRKKLAPQRSHVSTELSFGEAELERIIGADGCMTRTTDDKQREGRRKV